MKIDVHVHIFPPEIRHNREKFFPGEPDFKLLYESPKSRLVGTDDLLATMVEDGVDKSVVFGFPWRDAGISKLCNDYVIEAVRKYPDKLFGLSCFGFADPDAAASESERCILAGLNGVGELAFYVEGFSEKVVAEFTGTKYAIATVNGTAALHIALKLVGTGDGCEVITQPLIKPANNRIVYLQVLKSDLFDLENKKLSSGPIWEQIKRFISPFLNENVHPETQLV